MMNEIIKVGTDATIASLVLATSRKTLQQYIDVMPNGRYFDGHSGNVKECEGILILMNGMVVPYYTSISCINPLKLREQELPYLSTSSTNAPNFIPMSDMDRACNEYNEKCILAEIPSKCIVSYYKFPKYME